MNIVLYVKAINNLILLILFTDGNLAIIATVYIMIYLQICHLLLCIYHISVNIKKKAKFKLHDDMAKTFAKDFYHMKNSYTQDQFKFRYNNIL